MATLPLRSLWQASARWQTVQGHRGQRWECPAADGCCWERSSCDRRCPRHDPVHRCTFMQGYRYGVRGCTTVLQRDGPGCYQVKLGRPTCHQAPVTSHAHRWRRDHAVVDDNDGPDETAHFCAFCDGTITAAVGNDGSYTAEFDTPAGSRSVLLSASEVEEAMQSHTCLARMLKREHAKAENAAQHRAFVPTGPR